MGFLGKLVLTVALVGQAYLLFSEPTVVAAFNKNLTAVDKLVASNSTIPPIVKEYLHQAFEQPLYFRYTVIGLLSSSVVLLLACCSFIGVFPLLGLFLQMLITSNPLIDAGEATQVNLLKNLAIFGGVLIWASQNCTQKCNKNEAAKNKKD